MLLIRVIDLFMFFHDSNRTKQGGHVTLMWLAALSSVILVMWPCDTLKKSLWTYKQAKKGDSSAHPTECSESLFPCELVGC